MINTKIEYVVQVLHNSIVVDDAISIQLLLLSERKFCLSLHSDHHCFFSDTFNTIVKVINCYSL